jgi:hypothetical protein
MWQWYPRLIALVVFALILAALLGHGGGVDRGWTWS